MGIYGNEKDYEELVKEHIAVAKLLHSLSKEDQLLVQNLLQQKEAIKEKNGFLANFQLRSIDKKIEKIRNKYHSNQD